MIQSWAKLLLVFLIICKLQKSKELDKIIGKKLNLFLICSSKNELPLSELLSQKTKISEDEHCYYYLDPITKPLFSNPYKNYELRLNRKVNGTTKRPDFSCIIDGISLILK